MGKCGIEQSFFRMQGVAGPPKRSLLPEERRTLKQIGFGEKRGGYWVWASFEESTYVRHPRKRRNGTRKIWTSRQERVLDAAVRRRMSAGKRAAGTDDGSRSGGKGAFAGKEQRQHSKRTGLAVLGSYASWERGIVNLADHLKAPAEVPGSIDADVNGIECEITRIGTITFGFLHSTRPS